MPAIAVPPSALMSATTTVAPAAASCPAIAAPIHKRRRNAKAPLPKPCVQAGAEGSGRHGRD